jgi:nucleotide-binding universal stress UspA family protein
MATEFELGTDGPKVVLAGVDDTEPSLRAAAYAWGLARRQGARLILLYVESSSSMATFTAGGAALIEETYGEIAQELRGRLQEATQHSNGVDYEFMVARGDVFTEVARVADEVKADVLVVGASSQAGHRLIGSVAVRLVRAGRWPVTVVP